MIFRSAGIKNIFIFDARNIAQLLRFGLLSFFSYTKITMTFMSLLDNHSIN